MTDAPTDLAGPGTSAPEAPESLTATTVNSVGWSASSRLIVQVVQFGSTVVMARLLSPADYGLVAIVTAFTGFAWLFTDLGLGAAIIHRTRLQADELATAFWLNMITGIVLTGVFAALSPLVAHLYGNPELVPLTLLASLSFTLSAGTVHLALLQRAFNFKRIAGIEVTATLVASAVGISCAAVGVGAMSLVVSSLTTSLITTAALWISVRWLPRQFGTWAALRSLWSYSGHLVGYNALNYWSRNIDNLVIGKVDGVVPLAFYSRAYNLMLIPVAQVTTVVGRVLFPALSRLQGDPDRLRRAYLRSLSLIVAIATPISLALAISAGPFVEVVYGTKWQPAAVLLTILALAGPAQIVSATGGPLYQALGLTRAQFRVTAVNTSITLAAIFIGVAVDGARGVAVALLIKFYLLVPMTFHTAWKTIDLRLREVLGAMRAVWISALAMAAVTVAEATLLGSLPSAVLLAIEASTGVVVYLTLLWFVGRPIIEQFVLFLPGRLRRRLSPQIKSSSTTATDQAAVERSVTP